MKCSHCGSTKRLINYSTYKTKSRVKRYYMCNECNTERLKKYRKTPNGSASVKNANKKFYLKNFKRVMAWSKANYKIKNKEVCLICKKLPTHKHHPDIDKPLEVVFLCPYHHRQVDKDLLYL